MIDQISNSDPQSNRKKIEKDEGSNLFYLIHVYSIHWILILTVANFLRKEVPYKLDQNDQNQDQ